MDRSKSDGTDTKGLHIIKREIPIFDLTDKYTHWLIPKFTPITKEARLIPKWLGKMIIGKGMTAQEKEILTKMLYNRKVVLAWNFIEMGKVKRKITPSQEIWTVNHKAWQVPGF